MSDETGNPSIQLQQVALQQNMLQNQQLQLSAFWQEQASECSKVDVRAHDFKNHQLPLARIKKIMKTDEDVRMISGEAPILFAKAAEMFILELTLRSWIHTEENKRRTLQRNDIAMAITKTDVFDFLIDIVPRDDIKPSKKNSETQAIYQQQMQQQAAFMQQYIAQGGNPAMWAQQMQTQMGANATGGNAQVEMNQNATLIPHDEESTMTSTSRQVDV